MQKVSNRTCIGRLSGRSLKASRARNMIAVLAIALTAMLFTAVFTIALSLNQSFQDQNFRQAGGDFHGSFKAVAEEQMKELRKDPMIEESGGRLYVGRPQESPFQKSQVEIAYAEKTCADHMFCVPKEGGLPKEGTMEAATDTRVLELLGVKPEVGETFTLTYEIGTGGSDSKEVTSTFTLSGWWEFDPAGKASQVIVSESYAKEQLKQYTPANEMDDTGTWDLYIKLKSALHIQEDLNQILTSHGYQAEDRDQTNFIGTGVNWGYTGAQLSRNMDIGTAAGILAAVLLIVLTGYLIIYNIFRISVTGDIRFYGLLKTIGTTGKQIRSMIRRQALLLSGIGIPVGLLFGWFGGSVLTPVIISAMGKQSTSMSANPLIFAGAALFALGTVFLSCRKPARLAGKVSPVEAVRYTEGFHGKKKKKKGENGAKVWRMALGNLGRSKSKTVLVVLSLALAVVMLNATYTFTNGFNMDKYLQKWVSSDFILGSSRYFQSNFGIMEDGVTEDIIADVNKQEGIIEDGRIYGRISRTYQYVTEEQYRESNRKQYGTEERLNESLKLEPRGKEGMVMSGADIYGMEAFPVSKLEVLEGDLSKLSDESGDYIAAVVEKDDYDDPIPKSQYLQVGDQVTVVYAEQESYLDSRTGEEVKDGTPDEFVEHRVEKSHEKTYQVCARVTMRQSMGYRFTGREQMVLPAEEFIKQTGTAAVMTYLFDTTDESNARMEAYLKDYTEKIQVEYSYESKQSYMEQFKGFRNMFLLMGGALSLVIGIIGILNFINASVTSVISRKREFAVLQAVGMTGKQLKQMLMVEGCIYGISAILVSLVLNAILAPLISNVLSGMFWFYQYQFTILPILMITPLFLLLGALVPLGAYRNLSKQSVVDRIRNAD